MLFPLNQTEIHTHTIKHRIMHTTYERVLLKYLFKRLMKVSLELGRVFYVGFGANGLLFSSNYSCYCCSSLWVVV